MIGMTPDERIYVKLDSFDGRSGLAVFLYRYRPTPEGVKIYVGHVRQQGALVFDEAGSPGMVWQPEPTFFLSFEDVQSFRRQMMEALTKFGEPMPSESEIAGKLEATERHLEDMRSLVFHKLPKLSTESTGLST